MTLDPTTGTRAHATTWIALVSLLATIVGCGSKQPWESDAPAAGRNLILFTLDTMRADHITCYGGPDGLTPVLDRIAAEGTRFAEARSQSTGLYVQCSGSESSQPSSLNWRIQGGNPAGK